MTEYKEVRTVQGDPGHNQRVTTFKATQLIWLLFGIIEAAIGLRVLFKAIAVNPANPFAMFLYRLTDLFLLPFKSLVGSPGVDGMVLEISSIIAMVIYLMIAWVLERLVYVLFYRPRGPIRTRQTVISEHTPPESQHHDHA